MEESTDITVMDLRDHRPEKLLRLTVVEQIYLQNGDDDPKSYGSPYSRRIEQEEEAFSRSVVVEQEWVRLDPGWIKSCSQLSVVNTEGAKRPEPSRPAPASDIKVLEVSLYSFPEKSGVVIVRPGESCRLEPWSVDDIWVRSRSGKVRVTSRFFPS